MRKGLGTINYLLGIKSFIPKSVKEFRLLFNGYEEILSRKEAIKKYGDYDVYFYQENSNDKPTSCTMRLEYEYEEINCSTLHELIESLQKIEKEYGGDCQLYRDEDQTVFSNISYNKTCSNMLTFYIKESN